MKKLTLEEFGKIMVVAINNNTYYGERMGQAVFNATFKYYPEVADRLRGTGADCFHHFVNAILQ
jgi:hypothetical protein